jgi:hypothetical protein
VENSSWCTKETKMINYGLFDLGTPICHGSIVFQLVYRLIPRWGV